MKRSASALAALALAGFGSVAVLGVAAAESSCVKCHTNDATIKSLFVAPAQSSSEGEG
jgi:hypothetical protein